MNKYNYNYEDARIQDLVGKTITEIKGAKAGSNCIEFVCSDGCSYYMYHQQDCCESVYVEDIIGDIEDLINVPIALAEERSSDGEPKIDLHDKSFTWTFYTIGTFKGFVDIRWYGTSNGYYSESVDFIKST